MEYDHLCKLMTSRKRGVDFQIVKERLVEIMYTRGISEIEDLRNGIYSGCGKFVKLRYDIDYLLQKFEEIYQNIIENILDVNQVGLINIFAFQFAALVSLPYKDDNPNLYSDLDPIPKEILLEIIDMKYNDIKKYLKDYYTLSVETESALDENITSEYTDEVLLDKNYPIFFFRWMDHKFSMGKLLEEYFERVYYCEIVGKASYADSKCEEPIGFLIHDMFHGTEAEDNCIPFRKEGSFSLLKTPEDTPEANRESSREASRESSREATPQGSREVSPKNSIPRIVYKKDLSKLARAKSFYNFCKRNNADKIKQIQIILFYQIHEGNCFFDLTKERVRKNIRLIVEERFYDNRDLKMAIPKSHRTSNKTIDAYLMRCVDTYFEVYPQYEAWLLTQLGRIHESRRGKKHASWDGITRKRKKKTNSF